MCEPTFEGAIPDGTAVLVLKGEGIRSRDAQAFAERLTVGGAKVPLILLLHNDQTIEGLSEDDMAEAGWVRKTSKEDQ